MIDFKSDINSYLEAEKRVISSLDTDEINKAVNAIVEAREREGTIYTVGNGGSAATASHMVCDFCKGINAHTKGKKFRMECLCDNVPILTAISNDISYNDIFSHQLENCLTENDLLICISGSGNSENIVRAAKYAKSIGTPVLSMTGYSGGKLLEMSDYSMHAPIDDMQIAEDIHMIFDHMMFRIITNYEKNR